MKASARILITATTLAALAILGLAATATASVPTPPGGQQQPTTVEPTAGPQPGHGAQAYHQAHDPAPATGSRDGTDRNTGADAFALLIPALGLTLLVLLVGVAGATWLRRRRRSPAAA